MGPWVTDHFRNATTIGSNDEQKAIFKKQLESQSGKAIDDSLMDIAARQGIHSRPEGPR